MTPFEIALLTLLGLMVLLVGAAVLFLVLALRRLGRLTESLETLAGETREELLPTLTQYRQSGEQIERLARLSDRVELLLERTQEELLPSIAQWRRTGQEVERMAGSGRKVTDSAGRLLDTLISLSDHLAIAAAAGRFARTGFSNLGSLLTGAREAARVLTSRGGSRNSGPPQPQEALPAGQVATKTQGEESERQ